MQGLADPHRLSCAPLLLLQFTKSLLGSFLSTFPETASLEFLISLLLCIRPATSCSSAATSPHHGLTLKPFLNSVTLTLKGFCQVLPGAVLNPLGSCCLFLPLSNGFVHKSWAERGFPGAFLEGSTPAGLLPRCLCCRVIQAGVRGCIQSGHQCNTRTTSKVLKASNTPCTQYSIRDL